MFEMKKYILNENLMEVPKGFLFDAEKWLYEIFGSQFVYLCESEIKHSSNYLLKQYPNHDWTLRIKKLEETEDYLKLKYANPKMIDAFSKERGSSVRLKLKNYSSKYGDLSKISPSISLKYKKDDNSAYGQFSNTTSDITLFSTIVPKILKSYLGLEFFSMKFIVKPTNNEEEQYHWLAWDNKKTDEIIQTLVKSSLRTLEHEFIHLIQTFLFSSTITDLNYSTKDLNKYFSSDIEMNPWLVTSLDDFDLYLKRTNSISSNRTIEKFINSESEYFKVLKDVDINKYKKSVKSFYQLVDERIGVNNG